MPRRNILIARADRYVRLPHPPRPQHLPSRTPEPLVLRRSLARRRTVLRPLVDSSPVGKGLSRGMDAISLVERRRSLEVLVAAKSRCDYETVVQSSSAHQASASTEEVFRSTLTPSRHSSPRMAPITSSTAPRTASLNGAPGSKHSPTAPINSTFSGIIG